MPSISTVNPRPLIHRFTIIAVRCWAQRHLVSVLALPRIATQMQLHSAADAETEENAYHKVPSLNLTTCRCSAWTALQVAICRYDLSGVARLG